MNDKEYQKLCDNALVGAKDFDYSKLTMRLLTAIEYVKNKYAK
jgi:hypothetical protein